MWKGVTLTVLSAILIALLLPATARGQAINTDIGLTDRTWTFKASPGTDMIIFAWIPVLSVFDAEIFLIGECYRVDDEGEPVGKHRVIFKNIMLVGVDSENSVEATRSSQRIKNGLQKRQAVWGLTEAARMLFSADSAILVAGEIAVTRRVDAWDELTCGLGVMEILDVGTATTATGSERFEGSLMPVKGAQLPRLFEIPDSAE